MTNEEMIKTSLEDNIYNAEQKLKNKKLDLSQKIEQELIIKATKLYQKLLSIPKNILEGLDGIRENLTVGEYPSQNEIDILKEFLEIWREIQ